MMIESELRSKQQENLYTIQLSEWLENMMMKIEEKKELLFYVENFMCVYITNYIYVEEKVEMKKKNEQYRYIYIYTS